MNKELTNLRVKYSDDKKLYMKQWRANNKDKVADSRKRYREQHPEYTTYNSEWRKNNKHRLADNTEYLKQWNAANQDRVKQHRYNNRHNALQHSRLRRCAMQQAKPKWAVQQDLNLVYQKCYELNQLWGTTLTVDHAVPLRGETVCGLHVHENLQLLDKSLNSSKQHRYWPDMP